MPPSPDEASLISLPGSEYATRLLRVDGKPTDFDNYPMFRAIYDGNYPHLLLKTSRQVGKSTTIANNSIVESVVYPFFHTVFVSPSSEQTRRFSSLKLGPTIQYSPLVKRYFLGGEANRVFLRTLSNGSVIALSYAEDDPDRIRGLTADRYCLDEIQDIVLEDVEPVVAECARNSEFQYSTQCGTPKTNENAIESRWQASTQTEWTIKCESCNTYNAIRSEKSFSPAGPICLKCSGLINPRTGFWLDFNPGAKVKGFHISRAIMPKNIPACWNEGTPEYERAIKLWTDVFDCLDGPNPYPLHKFRNEIIGVSDSVGRRIITIEQLRALCTGSKISEVPSNIINMEGVGHIGAGIDWSGGGKKGVSRTVLIIVGLVAGPKVKILYYEIFPGTNPLIESERIAKVLNQYQLAKVIACDAGEGNMQADVLRRTVHQGAEKIVKMRYVTSDFYARWKKDERCYHINRTRSIDSVMTSLNRGDWIFPADDPNTEIIFKDILSEYEDVTSEGRKIWDHAPAQPDDCLHAMNYARMALQIASGVLDLTS